MSLDPGGSVFPPRRRRLRWSGGASRDRALRHSRALAAKRVVSPGGRAMMVWPGAPAPLGATWDGEGTNFALFSEHATAVELCLFDRPEDARERSAHPAARAHRPDLARLPARRPARPALRLPGARPVRAGARATGSIPPSCCWIPYAKAISGTIRWSDVLSGYAMDPPIDRARSRPRPARQRRRHAQVRRRRVGVHLGRRPAPAHAVEPDGDLRVPRQGHDDAAPRRSRAAPRHLPRPRHRSDHRPPAHASASPRSSCCRSTSSSPNAASPSRG